MKKCEKIFIGDTVKIIGESKYNLSKEIGTVFTIEKDVEGYFTANHLMGIYPESSLQKLVPAINCHTKINSFKIEPFAVITLCEGAGTSDDVCREVKYYYSMGGELIARIDPTEKK